VVDGDPLGAEHVGQLGKPLAPEGEREQRSAVQERAEGARDRPAEARGLQQAEAVGGRDAQGVRVPQDVVEHVAVRVDDALGAAGRSRREVDVSDRVRRDLDLRRTARTRRQVVDHEHLARRPGHRRGEIGGLAVGEDEASAQLVRDPGEVHRRIGRLQRGVGLAGPQRAEDRRDAGEALAVDQRDRLPSGAQPLDDRGGDAAGEIVELAVAQAGGGVRHGEAVPMGRGCAREAGRERLPHRARLEDGEPGVAARVLLAGGQDPRTAPLGRLHATSSFTPAPTGRHRRTFRSAEGPGSAREELQQQIAQVVLATGHLRDGPCRVRTCDLGIRSTSA
jgi:hypothetical protein